MGSPNNLLPLLLLTQEGPTDLDGGFVVFNLSLQTLVFLAQVLHASQVTAVVVGSHQQLLLPDRTVYG